MQHVSGLSKKKVGVAMQVAAMVMLLCAPYLPLLARAKAFHANPGRCTMVHRLCGCAPERIASCTCCCFKNMKRAGSSVKQGYCPLRVAGSHVKPHLNDDVVYDTPPTSPRMSSLPCGLDPQTISYATLEMKYLSSARAALPTHESAPHSPPPRADNYLNPSLETPVPPP